jgi:hypothetical protein
VSAGSNPLAEAYELAKKHRFVIATVRDFIWNPVGPNYYVEAYVLYQNRVRIGKRRDPSALLRMLKKAAGIA